MKGNDFYARAAKKISRNAHKQFRIAKSYLEAVISQSFYILYLVPYRYTLEDVCMNAIEHF